MPSTLSQVQRSADAFAAALKDEGVSLWVEHYSCVACQRTHYEGESLFRAHHHRQSRHGVARVSAARYAFIRRAGRQSP
jgi:hypothetical protein